MGFNLIYCTPMSGLYFFIGFILEKSGKFLKNSRFSGRIWPDWGNATRADMAGLGSIGLTYEPIFDIKGKLAHNFMISYSVMFRTFITEKNANIDVIHIYRENKIKFRNP